MNRPPFKNNLTIVIPFFNAENTLKNCLKSVFNQDFPFLEVLLVDNNSTDKSLEIAQEIVSQYSTKILNCKKQGAAAARNYGWKQAKGDYVAFIDSDVEIASNWSFEILNVFLDKEVVATQSKIIPQISSHSTRSLDKYRYKRKKIKTNNKWIELDPAREIFTVNTAACAYRKETLISLAGFEEALTRLEDTDLSYKALCLGTLAPCHSTSANVVYSGNHFTYLSRSFKEGEAHVVLACLWGSTYKLTSFNSIVKKSIAFEFLNYIFFALGVLFAKTMKMPQARSLKRVELLRKINSLTKTSP